MRIGIDGRPLQEKYGGVKEYTLNLLHALFSLDQKNEYHIFYNSFNRIDVPSFEKYPNVKTYCFHWPNKLLNLSMRLFNYPKFDVLMSKCYKLQVPTLQSGSRPKSVGATSYKLDLFYMPNLNFTAFNHGFKYIITVHDLSFHHFPEFYSLKQQLWHKAIGVQKLLNKATHIIAVSEHTKNDLADTFRVPQDKINVVYPCLNQNTTSYKLQATNYKPYILFLGTLEPRKNIESLIEAYKILKKKNSDLPKLVIVGPKGWKYKTIFNAVDSSIKNDVVFLDQVSEEKKIALYQNAKLFIFPSFYEGFGLPPLEAASFGVPVIASTASSLPEVLGDAAFYVNPWNVQELAEAIELLLSDDNLRQKLSEKGKQRAAQFNTQSSAQKLLSIFENYANRN